MVTFILPFTNSDLNIHLMKKNWKEVTLDSLEVQCSLPDATHRAGLCIVDIGVLHGNCPNITNYNGEQLGKMSPGFATWDSKIKSIFYYSYVIHGGQMEFKDWADIGWFKKKPTVPSSFGKERLPPSWH